MHGVVASDLVDRQLELLAVEGVPPIGEPVGPRQQRLASAAVGHALRGIAVEDRPPPIGVLAQSAADFDDDCSLLTVRISHWAPLGGFEAYGGHRSLDNGTLRRRMPRLDLAIRGGSLVDGAVADIGIAGERIAQIGGEFEADVEIDARGMLVLPGGVDAHVHLSNPPREGTARRGSTTSPPARPRRWLAESRPSAT